MIDSSSHLPLSRKSFHFLDQADSMDAYFFSISARLSISCRRWSHSLYPLSQRLTVRMYLPTSQKLSLLDCSMSSLTDMLMVYSQPLACWCTKDVLGPSRGKWLKLIIHSQFTSNLWTEIVHSNWKSVHTLSVHLKLVDRNCAKQLKICGIQCQKLRSDLLPRSQVRWTLEVDRVVFVAVVSYCVCVCVCVHVRACMCVCVRV